MRMLVVGAGSIGGLFGGRLVQAGRDVTFLVRPKRAEQLARTGLQIVSPHGDATVHPQLLTSADLTAPFEVVLLSVKAYSLEPAMADIAESVGPGTMILPVLNGMRHLEVLGQRFGKGAVIGGACKAATRLDDQGRIVQLTRLQEILYGELDGSASPRIAALDAFMQGAGFTARATDSIALEMWRKWALLASIGGVTCLARANTGEIEAVPGGRDFLLAFFREVVAVIEAVGMPLGGDFLADTAKYLVRPGAPTTSSMYRDLMGGQATEAEQIIGDLLRRGQAAGVATPLLAACNVQLAAYEQRRRNSGARA